jgi:hypothetical protein
VLRAQQAVAQETGYGAVAFQTEGPHIGKIALASALCDRDDMVGVPQGPAKTIIEVPIAQKPQARLIIELQKMQPQRDGVGAASGAYTLVTLEDFFAEIAGVGAEFPFVDTGLGAEGAAAPGDFCRTPPAEGPAIGSFGQFSRIDPAAGMLTLTGVHQYR